VLSLKFFDLATFCIFFNKFEFNNLNLSPLILAIPVYIILIGIELCYQVYKKEVHYRIGDALTNISCGIAEQVTGLYFKLFSIFIYTISFDYLQLFDINKSWLSFVLLFIATDFCYYWAHRMSHQVNLFWNGHAVHHQSEDYNLSVALRQGAFQTFFTAPFFIPLAIIGFPPEFFLFVSAFVTLYQFWIHTENIEKMGWFETVFNTPSHHRVHHGIDPKYIDKNHAGVFIIWDKMFGTFQEEEEKPTYGVTIPLNSLNPVKAQIVPFKLMFSALEKGNGLVDKLRIMLNPPGWFPDYAGGFKKPSEIDKSKYFKFEVKADKMLNGYGLVQYIIALALTSLFLFFGATLSTIYVMVGITGILVLISIIGALFEQKRWSFYAEIFRLMAMPIILYLFIPNQLLVLGGAMGFSIVSLFSLFLLKSKFIN